MFFDSHAHYDSEAFDADRFDLLSAFPEHSVDGVINCGCDPVSSASSVGLAHQYPFIWAAVGTHPEDAGSFTDDDLQYYRNASSDPRVVAIGEIGLDYHYDDAASPEKQMAVFRAQLDLAKEVDLPVILHIRDAMQDALNIVREYRDQVRGVFHCYGGSAETAKELLSLGWYLGFTGVLTFKNARKAVETVSLAPLDRLLIETDCPYMAPEPYRGHRCDSRMLEQTCSRMAAIKGISTEACAAVTQENARRLFSLSV